MAITEETRHRMYQKLEELMGSEEATVLMEHLPPVGWADVATKRDLEHLHLQLKLELRELHGAVRDEMHQLERRVLARLHASQLAVIVAVVGAVLGSAAWL